LVEHERDVAIIRGITPKFCTRKGGVSLVISLTRPLVSLNTIKVQFGKNSALDVIFRDSLTLLCKAPPGIPETVDVVILDGQIEVAIGKNAFSYQEDQK